MVPDTDLRRIERFCSEQVPDRFQHEVRWETHVRGKSVTICETRAPWDGSSEEWSHDEVAQVRYRPDSYPWSLHWADRNGRWHPYDVHGSHMAGSCAALLREIDADPTAIFKG